MILPCNLHTTFASRCSVSPSCIDCHVSITYAVGSNRCSAKRIVKSMNINPLCWHYERYRRYSSTLELLLFSTKPFFIFFLAFSSLFFISISVMYKSHFSLGLVLFFLAVCLSLSVTLPPSLSLCQYLLNFTLSFSHKYYYSLYLSVSTSLSSLLTRCCD